MLKVLPLSRSRILFLFGFQIRDEKINFQRFQPPTLTNGLAVLDAGNLELREEEDRKLGFAFREPTLPDISLLHGRMLVSAWECGLETGGGPNT